MKHVPIGLVLISFTSAFRAPMPDSLPLTEHTICGRKTSLGIDTTELERKLYFDDLIVKVVDKCAEIQKKNQKNPCF